MKRRLLQAVVLSAALAAVLLVLDRTGIVRPIVIALAVLVALVAVVTPWLGVRALDSLLQAARALIWRREQGRHHAFAGLSLRVRDDGRHVWLAGDDLQRVLGTHDAQDVLAARVAGKWRRDERGDLWLRVDGVVDHLSSSPGRMDPRTVRFRQYLDRELLFPAGQRRRRATPGDGGPR